MAFLLFKVVFFLCFGMYFQFGLPELSPFRDLLIPEDLPDCTSFANYFSYTCYINICPTNSFEQQWDYFEKAFSDQVIGQNHALLHFRQILYDFNQKDILKTFLMAGDNAVGKTLTLKLLTNSMFPTEKAKKHGTLWLNGVHFEGEDLTHGRQLFRSVFEQIQSCPKSIVIIEEIERIHPDNLAFLTPFMDPNQPYVYDGHKKVYSNDIIIGFVCDFGREAMTVGKTDAEVNLLMRREAERAWGTKVVQTISHWIPYYPLKSPDLLEILRKYLLNHPILTHHINDIKFTDTASIELPWLITKQFVGMMGRAPEQWARDHIDTIRKALKIENLNNAAGGTKRDLVIDVENPSKKILFRTDLKK